jgi:hypothetical protein
MAEDESAVRQLGVFLTGIGSLLFVSSVLTRFSRGVLLTSNASFIAGVFCILGFRKACGLFFRPRHIPATIALATGIAFIALRRGPIGAVWQLIGAFLMFGGFLPVVFNRLRKVPVIGPYLRVPLPRFVYGMNAEETLPR